MRLHSLYHADKALLPHLKGPRWKGPPFHPTNLSTIITEGVFSMRIHDQAAFQQQNHFGLASPTPPMPSISSATPISIR